MENRNCNYCKIERPIKYFSKNRKDQFNKSCDECRIKQKEIRQRNKCEHNRIKSTCKECGGSQICEHNRRKSTCKECGGGSICEHKREKSTCKECGGSQICEHNRIKSTCKECGGGSICEHNRIKSKCKECGEPVKITIKRMIYHSRNEDKKYNRYDPVKFIDYCFVEGLIEDYKKCYWCKVEMQYIEYNKTLATIERLDNKQGHNKDNCVLCCLNCNNKRISNK
jgi:hypothetical protein